MKLKKSIPSYVNMEDECAYVKYRNQIATCRYCGRNLHIGSKCSDVKKALSGNSANGLTLAQIVGGMNPIVPNDEDKTPAKETFPPAPAKPIIVPAQPATPAAPVKPIVSPVLSMDNDQPPRNLDKIAGYCSAVFHLKCIGVSESLLAAVDGNRQVFWKCRSCTTMLLNTPHRKSVHSAFMSGQESLVDTHSQSVAEMKSELTELKAEIRSNFASLKNSNSLTPTSSRRPGDNPDLRKNLFTTS
ncbi:hypothetical protein quinque_002459 [Culex quinquefasciatus]